MSFRTKPWLMATLLAALPVAAPAQPVDTPGVTAPLTQAQIVRNYPSDALSGAAVDKP